MSQGIMRSLAVASFVTMAACANDTTSVADMEAEIGTRLAQGPDAVLVSVGRGDVILSQGFSEALRTAVLANDGYLAALASEQEAFANINVVQSARRPQFSASSTIGATREGDPIYETMTGVSVDVSLTQIVYDGGASREAINRATAVALAAQAGRRDQANTTALDAARAWTDLWIASERLVLLRGRIDTLDALLGQMNRMASNGQIDRASLESAKRQVLDIQIERTGLDGALAQARSSFAQFFQTDRVEIGAPAQIVSPQMIAARRDEWQDAPALERAAAELIAAQRAQDEARSAFRPTVSLRAGVTAPMDQDDTTDLTGGMFIQYVFADGGRRQALFEAATKRVDALEAGLTAAQLATQTEIETSLARLSALEQTTSLVTQKIRLSSSEAEIARSQIATGQANLRQLISAEIESYRALDQRLQLEGEKYLLRLTIAARTGYLNEVIGL